MLNQTNNDRQVSLGEVPEDQAKSLLHAETAFAFDGLSDAAVRFTKVDNFTTFAAEYTYIGSDMVLHFFLPPELRLPKAKEYWLNGFPACLDTKAREYFRADYPRLMAKYTEEVESWWFRACGFSHVIDQDALVLKFLKELDEHIDQAKITSSVEA